MDEKVFRERYIEIVLSALESISMGLYGEAKSIIGGALVDIEDAQNMGALEQYTKSEMKKSLEQLAFPSDKIEGTILLWELFRYLSNRPMRRKLSFGVITESGV